MTDYTMDADERSSVLAGLADPESVQFFASPWISGTRASAYFGPVHVERLAPEGPYSEELEMRQLLADLAARISVLGGNAGVGLEIQVDPFLPDGARWFAVCTAARLEPLY